MLDSEDLGRIHRTLSSIGARFGWAPDVEWTGRGTVFTLLQARPVTMGTVPLFLLPLAYLFLPDEGIGPRRIAGLALGLAGRTPVVPGIAAVILTPELERPDRAYPEVMKLLPVGLKGLVFAALIAAIVSSLASMTNSISTIFTMDMYRHFRPEEHSERKLVMIGRTVCEP